VFVYIFTYGYTEFVCVGVYICVYVHRVYMGMCIHRMIVSACTHVRGAG